MNPHPIDPLSLISGVLFVAVGAIAIAGQLHLALVTADWFWPGVLLAAGTGLLLTVGIGGRKQHDDPPADAAPDDEA